MYILLRYRLKNHFYTCKTVSTKFEETLYEMKRTPSDYFYQMLIHDFLYANGTYLSSKLLKKPLMRINM